MHMEEWKNIEGKEGEYQVSNFGRVKSLERTVIRSNGRPYHARERLLMPCVFDECGHLIVSLRKNGIHECKQVHQLVAQAFIPNPNNYTDVHHIDHNPSNNCVENLVWISKEEHGSLHAAKKAKTVYQYTLDGELVRVWDSIMDIERELGYSNSHICECCNGKYKQMYGYIWSFEPL